MARMKNEYLTFRYTGAGKEKVNTAAEKLGMTVSEYSRAIISAVTDAVLTTDGENFYLIEKRLSLIGRMLNAKYQARQVEMKFEEIAEEMTKDT